MTREPDMNEIFKSPKTLIRDEDGNLFFGWQFVVEGKWQFIIDVDGTEAVRERAVSMSHNSGLGGA